MGVRLSGILLPAASLGANVAFYAALLEVEPMFVDGDRYAALPPADRVGLALAAGAEAVTDRPALVLRVDDIDTEVDRAVALGGIVHAPVHQGPHELRAVVLDPSGNPVVLSQKT